MKRKIISILLITIYLISCKKETIYNGKPKILQEIKTTINYKFAYYCKGEDFETNFGTKCNYFKFYTNRYFLIGELPVVIKADSIY